MTRSLRLLFAALVVLAAFGTSEAKEQKIDKQELKKLQGTWVMVSGEVDGTPVPAASVKKSRMRFSGETINLDTPDQSKRTITAHLKRLDPKKAPPEMDWVRSAGPHAGTTMQAIYEFDGKDRYKVCFDPSGKGRPTAFATGTGGCHVLHVWKRVKKA